MPSFTLTVSDADAQRIAKALGQWLGLRNAQGNLRSATAQEGKQGIAQWLQGLVHSYELQEEQAKIAVPTLTIS